MPRSRPAASSRSRASSPSSPRPTCARPSEFNNIIIANIGGYPVRLRDVGSAAIGAISERSVSRYNGKPSLNIGVIKQAVANPLELSKAVYEEVALINPGLPPGMKLVVAYDTSVFIDRSITSVFTTIGEAILLVVLVIFFFLRSLRATIIPIVTIPGVAGRRVRADVRVRFHDQHADAARDGARDRPRRRRRHRHAGEHLPPHRGRHPAAAGGDSGGEGDRVRRRRDDPDAGIGVRAAGVRDRTHRSPVHRVRADAGRRGHGLRLRRADADADDVLAAAAPRGEALVDLQLRRARPDRGDERVPAPADGRAARPVAGRAAVARHGRAGGVLLHAAEVGARPDRGSRRRVRPRHRAAGLDARVHGRPDPADRAVLRADSRGGGLHGDRGFPDRRRRQRGAAVEALGAADQAPAADHRRAAAEVRVDPRCDRVPGQPAVAGAVGPLDADRVRRDVAGPLSGAPAHRRPLPRGGAQVPGRAEPADRPAPQHARGPGHDQPRQAVRHRRAESTPSAARWRRCWAAGR